MTEITLVTQDNVEIAANHYQSGFDSVIIICPGFLMHRNSKPFLLLSEQLNKKFDIITLDFRGHGTSKGWYTFTSREYLDLRAAVAFAKPRYNSIGVLGFSLGGSIAINEVAKSKNVDRLMIVSAPADFAWIENRFLTKEVVMSTIKKFDLKMACVRLGNILLAKTRPIDNVDKISPIPILFLHGEKDTIVRPRHSMLLYERAKEPKHLIIWRDCLHAEDLFFGANSSNFLSLCAEWFGQGKAAI